MGLYPWKIHGIKGDEFFMFTLSSIRSAIKLFMRFNPETIGGYPKTFCRIFVEGSAPSSLTMEHLTLEVGDTESKDTFKLRPVFLDLLI